MTHPLLAGELNSRVEILRRTSSDDGFATTVGNPVSVAKIWAKRRDLSATESLAAKSQATGVFTRFVMRDNSISRGIKVSDQLKCRGEIFEVIGSREDSYYAHGVALEISASTVRS